MTHEAQAQNWIGRKVSFDRELGNPLAGQRLVGLIEDCRYVGSTKRGEIPNYQIMVRGASGKTCEVNLVEQYAFISE